MTKAAYLYGIHDKMLQKRHSSHQKYHLIKMTSHKNGISQKSHIKIYIIGFL